MVAGVLGGPVVGGCVGLIAALFRLSEGGLGGPRAVRSRPSVPVSSRHMSPGCSGTISPTGG
ncbi:LytS/YhcK type 5TM receptor domain-containing protein [Methanogenium cariaci]|uniref:LytS/YhcK type 5TM receptor domain-containing protein n=1 Tax=Methanogenium cariaci TaxID=2197 RepID=UPI00247FBB2E|nr:LytS/YhcK type 5TM receptor domain-containing protein [Methanogenium cariaci]